jgi:hypothetical protein
MIAAAYRANDLPIHTRNPDDFSRIAGLNVVAQPHPTTEDPRWWPAEVLASH